MHDFFFQRLKGTSMESLNDRVKQNYKLKNSLVFAEGFPEWFNDIDNGKIAFVTEINHMKSMIGKRFLKTGKCGIYVTPIGLCQSFLAFAFRRKFNPNLLEEFNRR